MVIKTWAYLTSPAKNTLFTQERCQEMLDGWRERRGREDVEGERARESEGERREGSEGVREK